MGQRSNRTWKVGLAVALSVLAGGCGLRPSGPTEPADSAAVPTEAPTAIATEAIPTATATIVEPTATSTPALPEATEAAAAVDVLVAAIANLNIRRGPGTAYNVVGFMSPGQETRGIGRDTGGDWLYVERPEQAGSYGWLYHRGFTSVQGDVMVLPEVTPDPPLPAYLRNCTYHPMQILPDGFILAGQSEAPDNQRPVNPGHYETHDLNVEGDPLVFTGEIREGQTVEILTDGLHNSYACPG